ncbi:MAG: hypothetical protein AAGI48_01710 [Verrucomicrobiota bacterium]
METFIISSISILSLLSPAHAQDESKPWSEVSFKVMHDDSAAAVNLQGDTALEAVILKLIGKTMSVPEEEFEGIDNPDLSTAQLYFGEDYYGEFKEGEEPIPHYIIEVVYGEKSKFGMQPTVKFLFHSGSYQERTVAIQETETVWKLFTKLPGEEAEESGTQTRPPHRPAPVPSE